MFCPTCRDEFRPGFTRCATCDVDLVEHLGQAGGGVAAPAATPSATRGRLADFCGFLTLDEARHARDRLRTRGILTEIAIRDTPGTADEEYWLRVERDRVPQVVAELGEEPADEGPGSFQCDACHQMLPGDATVCSRCGQQFEDGV